MKDYTIAQICDLYRTDVKECAELTSHYYSQSLIFEEHTIKNAFSFIFSSLSDLELNHFYDVTKRQLQELDYVVCNPLYEYEGYGKKQAEINAELIIFRKQKDDSKCLIEYSNYQLNGMAEHQNTDIGVYENSMYAFNCRSFDSSMGHAEIAEVINNLRIFYKSDFYLNVFTPQLEARKFEWLIPAKKDSNKKSKI